MIVREILLVYPNSDKPFDVHTNSRDYQLPGGVVSQDAQSVVFFSQKFNSAQKNYPVTEKELLGKVETLKEFCHILLDHRDIVWIDHKNLSSSTVVLMYQ